MERQFMVRIYEPTKGRIYDAEHPYKFYVPIVDDKLTIVEFWKKDGSILLGSIEFTRVAKHSIPFRRIFSLTTKIGEIQFVSNEKNIIVGYNGFVCLKTDSGEYIFQAKFEEENPHAEKDKQI